MRARFPCVQRKPKETRANAGSENFFIPSRAGKGENQIPFSRFQENEKNVCKIAANYATCFLKLRSPFWKSTHSESAMASMTAEMKSIPDRLLDQYPDKKYF